MINQSKTSAAQISMKQREIDLVCLLGAANLFDSTGIRRQLGHGAKRNRHCDLLGHIGQVGRPRSLLREWVADSGSMAQRAKPVSKLFA